MKLHHLVSIAAIAAITFIAVDVFAQSTTTVWQNAISNPQAGATSISGIIIGIIGLIGWLWPTAHDGGNVPGRVVNILQQILTAMAYIGQMLGLWKVNPPATDMPAPPSAAPVAAVEVAAAPAAAPQPAPAAETSATPAPQA